MTPNAVVACMHACLPRYICFSHCESTPTPQKLQPKVVFTSGTFCSPQNPKLARIIFHPPCTGHAMSWEQRMLCMQMSVKQIFAMSQFYQHTDCCSVMDADLPSAGVQRLPRWTQGSQRQCRLVSNCHSRQCSMSPTAILGNPYYLHLPLSAILTVSNCHSEQSLLSPQLPFSGHA